MFRIPMEDILPYKVKKQKQQKKTNKAKQYKIGSEQAPLKTIGRFLKKLADDQRSLVLGQYLPYQTHVHI